jgi:uncharacterized protein YcbK (DUF882 family)
VSAGTKVVTCVVASLATMTMATAPAATEGRVPHGAGLASRKGPPVDAPEDRPVLATLDCIHGTDHLALDSAQPDPARFDALVADRATGTVHPIDPAILTLLRALAADHPGSRIEIVSGYRSPKLNEMLRKKGHHVASHSLHTLGHACDFRIVPPGADRALDPRSVEIEIRRLGWAGGTGVYPSRDDWFVHADTGRTRRWVN